jgi:hypothetical protein
MRGVRIGPEHQAELEALLGDPRVGATLGGTAITVAFERLGLTEVVSYTMVENRASRRVMEKLGFEYEREVVHANLPHVLYRLRTSSPRPPVSASSPAPP